MVEKELIPLLNKDINTNFPDHITTDELKNELSDFINDLIQKDFQKLVSILYRVDVDETKLKRILKEQADKDAAVIIANLILERELQKIETRKKFK
jgi:hypothetical protein